MGKRIPINIVHSKEESYQKYSREIYSVDTSPDKIAVKEDKSGNVTMIIIIEILIPIILLLPWGLIYIYVLNEFGISQTISIFTSFPLCIYFPSVLVAFICLLFLYYYYHDRVISWSFEKESGKVIYRKVKPKEKTFKTHNFSRVKELVCTQNEFGYPGYNLLLITVPRTRNHIYNGIRKDCEDLGIQLSAMLSKPFIFRKNKRQFRILFIILNSICILTFFIMIFLTALSSLNPESFLFFIIFITIFIPLLVLFANSWLIKNSFKQQEKNDAN